MRTRKSRRRRCRCFGTRLWRDDHHDAEQWPEYSSDPTSFADANALSNDVDSIKLKGSFLLGDHTIMAGYERGNAPTIFNLFVPRSQGQWTFASIDDFEAQVAIQLLIQQRIHERRG